jgi:hypothetical protein
LAQAPENSFKSTLSLKKSSSVLEKAFKSDATIISSLRSSNTIKHHLSVDLHLKDRYQQFLPMDDSAKPKGSPRGKGDMNERPLSVYGLQGSPTSSKVR